MIQKLYIITLWVFVFSGLSYAGNNLVMIEIKSKAFMLEVVDTDEKRQQGLMFRDHLSADQGMLFVFPDEKKRSFWMKNTWIPLTIVYIRADGVITDILSMTPDNKKQPIKNHTHYASSVAVKYAIEFNKGVVEKLGLKPGDRLPIKRLL